MRFRELDGLRGLSCLMVAVPHAVMWSIEQSQTNHPLIWSLSVILADAAVLNFFVLSGFVIGKVTEGPFNLGALKVYLLKRGARILPIYFIGLVFGYFAAGQSIWTREFLTDALFLQTWFAPLPPGNGALWSLHYEMMFYILFPFSWAFGLNPIRASAVSAIIGLGSLVSSAHVFCVAAYFSLWLLGLHLARQPQSKDSAPRQWIAVALFVQLAFLSANLWSVVVGKIAPSVYALDTVPHPLTAAATFWSVGLIVATLGYTTMPACYLGVAVTAALSFVMVAYAFVHGLMAMASYQIAATFLFLAIIALFTRPKIRLDVPPLTWIGDISYGIYAIHFPFIWIALDYTKDSHSLSYNLACTFLALIAAVVVAALLELRMQPIISRSIRRASQQPV